MMPAAADLPSGFVLNVYKEIPWTSHDAVSRVRRILGTRQVGHAGSLDPFASGVLIVAVGRATRLVEYLMNHPKRYRGTLVFGRRTSSGDAGGAIVEEGPAPQVDRGVLEETARAFLGSGFQVPPMVSAVKHEGKRLHELARKGVTVERAPRPIHIERFEILDVELPRVDFELDCGRGTYVRTLVEDFAARLGAIASVESLMRLGVGPFDLGDASRLISEPGCTRDGLLAQRVSMAEALAHLPAVPLGERWARQVRHRPGQVVRLLGTDGDLIATAVVDLMPGPADRPIEQSCHLRLDRVL